MDVNGYPDESELKKIREWDYKNLPALMEYIRERWKYADTYYGIIGDRYHLSTAGWSGNESIISALKENQMFWTICWQESKRGGHYIFKVKALPLNDIGGRKFTPSKPKGQITTFQAEIAELKAENERLKKDLKKQIDKNAGKPPLRDGVSPESWAKIYDENKMLKDTLRESARRFERMEKSHYEIDWVLDKP